MVLHFPPCLLTGAHPLHTPLHCGRLFSVGCCVSHCQSAAVQRQRCILYSIFFIAWVVAPNNGTVSPHVLSCRRASCQTYPLPLPPPIGWLLVTVIKRQPPKAKAPPISLFFDGSLFGAPNKGADNGKRKPDTVRLPWTDRKRRHHELGPWRLLPWR